MATVYEWRKRLAPAKDFGEAYEPAMHIEEQAEADNYLAALVLLRVQRMPELTSGQALEMERKNLGYFAGYYSHETRIRVERLFSCKHPYLPPAAEGRLTDAEVFRIGFQEGLKQAGKEAVNDPQERE